MASHGSTTDTIDHLAVQTCGWTDSAMQCAGACYKNAFYGIESHRCVQMTPVQTCNERCVFCWRDHGDHGTPDDRDWADPAAVAQRSIERHRTLVSGYGGHDDVPRDRFEESREPRHVAISLDGEPTLYPYLPELIEVYRDRGLSTFLVTNGTRPERLAACDPTQLYCSVDAPDPTTYEQVVRPAGSDAWGRLGHSLDVLAAADGPRTAIRITLVEGHNDHDPAGYARMIERAAADVVEVKAYMHVGHSRDRLDRSRMPDHATVCAFADRIAEHLPHDRRADVAASRVALLAQSDPPLETSVPDAA
ncbi:MAG: 4-demethylwyosine synthase TYW1 [Halococcoides sp.]